MGIFDNAKKKIKEDILNDASSGENTDDGYYNAIDHKDLRRKGFSKKEIDELQYEADYNSQRAYDEGNDGDDYGGDDY
jgi:hypothetical protein